MDVNSRQGDLADQASGNNEVHIQLKLKQTDAKILQAIEEALYRMEKGTYGVCRDCGDPIAPATARGHSLDARLHQLQAEAEPVTPAEMVAVVREFHREKLALRQRHVAVARQVSDYDANNTYQYVIAREDVHLSWLEAAIGELGGTPEIRWASRRCPRAARRRASCRS